MNRPPVQLPLDLGLEPAWAREDFLATPGNAAAVAWIDRPLPWPVPALVLHGPPGCGKSHLLAIWCRHHAAYAVRPEELQPERVPDLLTAAVATAATASAGGTMGRIDSIGGVAVDDSEELVAAPESARALLHLYNLLVEARRPLLLSGCSPPARWNFVLPDLRSRLLAVPAVALSEPDDTLLAAMLVKLFADRQLRPEPDVIAYLVRRIERSGAAARDVVAALDRAALAAQRPVTIPLVRALWATPDGLDS